MPVDDPWIHDASVAKKHSAGPLAADALATMPGPAAVAEAAE